MKSLFRLAFLITIFFFFSPLKQFPILFFVPFLVFFSSYFSLSPLLWLAFFSGLFVDLFSTGYMGENASLYLLASLLLFREKKFFFDERPLYLAIFSALFVVVCELCRWICFIKDPLVGKNLLVSLCYFSVYTFFYAIIGFAFPLFLWQKGSKMIRRWTLLRRK